MRLPAGSGCRLRKKISKSTRFPDAALSSPRTAGAVPAAKIVAVDPNEALVHGNLTFLDGEPNPLPMGYHVVVLAVVGNLPGSRNTPSIKGES